MFHSPTIYSTKVPNSFQASLRDIIFVSRAVQDEAGNIQNMLPDAFAVVKTAAAILGILALGCAIVNANRSDDQPDIE